MSYRREMIVSLIFCAFFLLPTCESSAAVIRVDCNGGGDYTTISDALAAAESGDTIQVAECVYPEVITLADGIELLGGFEAAGWTRDVNEYITVIDAAEGTTPPVSASQVSGAVFDGFSVINWSPEAVRLEESQVTISNNRLESPAGSYGTGIYALNSESVLNYNYITGGYETGLADGILVYNMPAYRLGKQYVPDITNNLVSYASNGIRILSPYDFEMDISGNSLYMGFNGIYAYNYTGSVTPTLSYNTIYGEYGIQIQSRYGELSPVITNNVLNSYSGGINLYSYYYGPQNKETGKNDKQTWAPVIESNDITAFEFGIHCLTSALGIGGTISQNVITGTGRGVWVFSDQQPIDTLISGNYVTSSTGGMMGIACISQNSIANPTIASNTVLYGQYGIGIYSSEYQTSGVVSDNTVNVGYTGISIINVYVDGNTEIKNNEISGHAQNGIEFRGEGSILTPTITDNDINGGRFGIIIDGNNEISPTISQNTIHSQDHSNIFIMDEMYQNYTSERNDSKQIHSPIISDNVLYDAGETGIMITNYNYPVGGVIAGNLIHDTAAGVYFEALNECSTEIANNLIYNEEHACVNVDGAYQTSIYPNIWNNTFAYSYDGVWIEGEPLSPTITNNIIVSNTNSGISIIEGFKAEEEKGSGQKDASIDYNDVWNNGENYVYCTPGPNDISADPLFASGPDGDYYLSQTAAGQSQDSPCLDAGSAPADSLSILGTSFGEMTTRTDEAFDSGTVDMGYHYAVEMTPTPVLTGTPTETPTDTPTEIPTDTPTETPTDTPTETPTLTFTPVPTDTPTGIPTATQTSSPVFSPTVTPSPTQTFSPTQIPSDTPTMTETPVYSPTVTLTPTQPVIPALNSSGITILILAAGFMLFIFGWKKNHNEIIQ